MYTQTSDPVLRMSLSDTIRNSNFLLHVNVLTETVREKQQDTEMERETKRQRQKKDYSLSSLGSLGSSSGNSLEHKKNLIQTVCEEDS